jgi:hypothetical protein
MGGHSWVQQLYSPPTVVGAPRSRRLPLRSLLGGELLGECLAIGLGFRLFVLFLGVSIVSIHHFRWHHLLLRGLASGGGVGCSSCCGAGGGVGRHAWLGGTVLLQPRHLRVLTRVDGKV